MKYDTCTDYWLDKKTGEFRGNFEEMYKDIDDPWGCEQEADSLVRNLFLEILFNDQKFETILDIGCGLGGFTSRIYDQNPTSDVVGFDISKTAVEQANERYPGIDFRCRNILEDPIKQKFNLIIMSEIIWYLLDDLPKIFSKMYDSLDGNGNLGIQQYFPFDQDFGKETLNGLEGFYNFIEMNTKFEFNRKAIFIEEGDGEILLAKLTKKNPDKNID